MDKKQLIEYLLNHGNASQKYIVLRDILSNDIHSKDMVKLQDSIVQSKAVQKMLKSQQESGWFGLELHGVPAKAMDSTVTYLIELGIEPTQPFMRKAKHALLAGANPYLTITSTRNGFDRGYNFAITNR